ncbi:hypothetical protein MPLA_930067 [Mesorhizobium sp. ORS 3359]|jgi:hypothetical protein|nr:hypothetical protein MPLA_930067 [Mesorhizobium sp. ORS 3359]
MGKKAKLKAKRAAELPTEGPLSGEAAYYARKCGITIDEAAKIILDANTRSSRGKPIADTQKAR